MNSEKENLTQYLSILHRVQSSDRSIKYIFQTTDGHNIESVYIPQRQETKFCISCQVGCVNKCSHCATGKVDYVRDLTSREIVSQVISMVSDNPAREKKLHVLFMGMGEPFLNLENVMDSLDLFSEVMNIPEEEVTISTSGIVPTIYDYSHMNRNSKLAISVHATSDLKRNRIVPLNKIYPLSELMKAAKYYVDRTDKRVIIEYCLMDDFNDSLEEAEELVSMLEGLHCEVHLIPFNENINSLYRTPPDERIGVFNDYIRKNHIVSNIKRSYGIDVKGGCGQLCLSME